MNVQFTENKLIELFIEIDDLFIAYQHYRQLRKLEVVKKLSRPSALSGSEVCTILVVYHLSGYKCFEYYYKQVILASHKSDFPDAPSYECFLSYIEKAADLIYLWLFYTTMQSTKTGLYFVDSKKLAVCHLKREKSNKVFASIAAKGKTSTGWFFGLKIHLVINNLGQIMAFALTPG